MNGTIGIIGAMDIEITTLKNAMSIQKSRVISGMTFFEGMLDGCSVVLVQCGIGKVFAAVAAEILSTIYHVDFLVNTGVGGGIAEGLNIGDVVVATHLVQHDMDTTPIGDPPGLISGINVIEFHCDEHLCTQLEEAMDSLHIPHRRGIIASGDQFIAHEKDKERLRQVFNASVCEMEGGAIGQVAYINHIPCAVLRAISDNGDASAQIDYPTFAKEAANKSARIIRCFLKSATQ